MLYLMVLTINSITSYEGWLGVVYSIYILVFSLIFLRGKLLTKIFVSIFTVICLISVSTFVANLISLVFKTMWMRYIPNNLYLDF